MSAAESSATEPAGHTLPRRVEKPWGHEIWWAATDQYVGKILHVNKGHRLSLQYHDEKDESCYVLAGRLILVQGESQDALVERIVSVGDVWHNAPGTIHTIEALEDAEVLEASTPLVARRRPPPRRLRPRGHQRDLTCAQPLCLSTPSVRPATINPSYPAPVAQLDRAADF